MHVSPHTESPWYLVRCHSGLVLFGCLGDGSECGTSTSQSFILSPTAAEALQHMAADVVCCCSLLLIRGVVITISS
jgi:hypothetical protein